MTKNKEKIQKFKEIGDTKYIYKNELDKYCFQHDMAYGYFRDLARRTASDKVLRDEAFNIVKNSTYVGSQRGFASMVYNFFDKKASGRAIKSISNNNLQMNFIKQLFKKIKKEEFMLHLNTIFGVLILQMYN